MGLVKGKIGNFWAEIAQAQALNLLRSQEGGEKRMLNKVMQKGLTLAIRPSHF